MSDQYVMNQAGELVPDQPRSWDGEPLYCADTVREGLFDPSAFEQMPGQMDIERMMGEAWDGSGGFFENRERNS